MTFILVLLSFSGFAQKLVVRGGFVQDHFELGDEVHYYLTATYPDELSLVFPDSTDSFGTFEYISKNYYPSKRLPSGLVYDTAIYTLQCYEIDPAQGLSMPVSVLQSTGDSTRVYARMDSILFHTLAPVVSDTTTLKTNVAFTEVNTLFNFPLLWVVLSILLILVVAGYLIFGNKIKRELKLRRLKKDYTKFSDELTEYIRQLKSAPDKSTAERALISWKSFSERMENHPYSRLTTKEILALGYTNELHDPLRKIDRCVYGGAQDEDIYRHFQSIEDFTQHRYSIVVDKIKNPKA